jgi:hypothetical protein
MHGSDSHVMHQLWIVVFAVPVDPVAGRASVMGQINVKPHVAGHAHGGFHTEVGEITGHDQALYPGTAQIDLQ